jgi:hypothetical protein
MSGQFAANLAQAPEAGDVVRVPAAFVRLDGVIGGKSGGARDLLQPAGEW